MGHVNLTDFDVDVAEFMAWRRDFHTRPELGFREHRMAALVAERLSDVGVGQVMTGVGETGVFGVIAGKMNTKEYRLGTSGSARVASWRRLTRSKSPSTA